MRIVCVSDTHNKLDRIQVPDGDILIHAGDLTRKGHMQEIARAARHLALLPHKHKVVIAGNHDWGLQHSRGLCRLLLTEKGICYLEESEAEICGLRFWGSPWTPWFLGWAFNWPQGESMKRLWDQIPDNADVVVTHGPPRGHGDRTEDGRDEGCPDLLGALRRVRPKLHVFGHIHEGYGVTQEGPTRCVNASACTADDAPTNPAVVVDL